MKNNLNQKNNSISNSINNIINLNNHNINIIPSRTIIKNKKLDKKKSKKHSKKDSKIEKKSKKEKTNINPKQKRIIPLINKYTDFPQGKNYSCIGPCYPAKSLYYHPLTLQGIKNKFDSCPINIVKGRDDIFDKCEVNENFDYENYDIFNDVVQIASSDNDFLKQIYNIKNINDVENFLENNLIQLPILSQIRLCNSIYKVYRDNDMFPSDSFIDNVKKIIEKKYNLKIKSEKIINKIMSVKHSNNTNDLFQILTKQ